MPHKRKDLGIVGANLWYLVGLIASDGNLSLDGIHIDITSSDYEFLWQIKEVNGIRNKIGVKYGAKKKRSFRIQIANRSFYDFLVSVGLTQKKSLTIGALKVSNQFFVDFLRGLIDGDGSIRKWKHPTNFREQWSLRIYSGSEKFIKWLYEKIKEYFKACGRIHQYKTQGSLYVLKFGKIAAKKILGECYYENGFALQRKYILAKQCVNSREGWKASKTVLA